MRTATLLLALALAAPASGQTRYEWVGGASGVWSEPTNWSPTGVPAAADTAVVGEVGQGQRLVTLTEATTVAGLELIRLGIVAGDFDLTVTDRLVWGGGGTGFDPVRGTGTVTVGPDAVMRVTEDAGRVRVSPGRTLLNEGRLVWEAPVGWDGEGRLVNRGEMDLAFDTSSDVLLVFSSLADAVTNAEGGVIRRTGTGLARLTSGLVNDGLLRVEQGQLELNGFNATGTTGSGSAEISAGATLVISGASHTVASVTGDAVTLTAGRLTVSGAYDVATTRLTSGPGRLVLDANGATGALAMEGGFIDGSGTLTVTGALDWSGGQMLGSGTTALGPTIPLTIGGSNQVSLGGTRTLRTEGPVTWTGDADLSSGTSTSVFENAGTLTSSGPGERTTSFLTFRNTGMLVHDGGTLHVNSPMANAGTVRIEDGTLRLGFSASGTDTGRYEIGDAGRLEIAVQSRTLAESAEIVGTGTVAFNGGTVTNRALWRPGTSPGILTIDSDWPAPAPEAVLDIEISGLTPGTEHDQLAVAGMAALGGTLRVTFTDGFTLSDDDRILLIPAAAVTGTFDAIELPAGLEAYIDVTAVGVELVAGSPVAGEDGPEAPLALALAAPAPNPAAGSVGVGYALPEAGPVRLTVLDMLGREVAVLADGERPAGAHTARLDTGRLAPGVYVVRLWAGGEAVTRTLTVAR